ncbi:MAG: GxxExxY protein [Firmicutes bacterium]|nr:GxxExxY protein [Bacillota bacterium]
MDTNKYEFGDDLIFKDEVFRIIGAALNVAHELGCGFLEAVYQEALEIELAENDIPFESQKKINICYKGKVLNKEYLADFVCFNKIIVEIKAIKRITEIEEAQIINYLKAAKLLLGLIINFGSMKLEWKRYANTKRTY